MSKIFKRALHFVRSSDSFGHPISLTYKQSPTFKSTFGGSMTLIANGLILISFIIMVISVANRSKYTINIIP